MEAANAAYEQGRSEQSISLYNRVIALSAGAPKTAALAQLRMGNIYLAQRKFDQALNSFKQATLLDPNSADAHNNLGEALGELKQYKPAIESFNRAVALDPKLLKARYNLAISYSRMGSQKYAEFVFRNLIKSNRDYSLAYDGLAVTLSRAGRAKEALPLHERAIELSPNDPYYHYNLALSYLTLGDTAKAVEQQKLLSSIDTRVADQLASVIVKRKL
jgi:tetratricopeptide (TPR) repeat protein